MKLAQGELPWPKMEEKFAMNIEEGSVAEIPNKGEEKGTVHIVAEIILAVILVGALAVLYFAVSPFKRGFFCADTTIQKPYTTHQAVPSKVLLGVGVALGVVVVRCFTSIQEHLNIILAGIMNSRSRTRQKGA